MHRLVELAESVARKAHAGQVDKSGQPYIDHVLRVAAAIGDDEDKAVALLHDVLEDVKGGRKLMIQEGVPQDIIDCVEAMSRFYREPYEQYIERLANYTGWIGETCRRVKLADLRDNLRPGAESLKPRYLKAIARLERAQQATTPKEPGQ